MKLKLDILKTLNALLDQEDTDGDKKLTIEDKGPKSFVLTDAKGKKKITIEGTFHLSNLLQESYPFSRILFPLSKSFFHTL